MIKNNSKAKFSPPNVGGVARSAGVVYDNTPSPLRGTPPTLGGELLTPVGVCKSRAKAIFRFSFFIFSSLLLLATMPGCTKDETNYGVNNENLLPPGAGKTKIKSNEQYVSILYANFFQTALSANRLYDISKCIESIGDKDVAKEVIISNFMNKPDVQIPADTTMRNDVPTFVTNTYNRFLVRNPTEAEKTWFTNYINANPNVTPELVYFSFALCDEYQYY